MGLLVGLLFWVSLGLVFMGFYGLFSKNGKAKKRFKGAGIALVVSIILLEMDGGTGDETQTEQVATEVTEEVTNEPIEAVAEDTTSNKEEKAVEPKPTAKPKEESYTIGDTVKVGDFEYIINSSNETTKLESDNEFIEDQTTEGKFVVVDYTVKNVDNETRMVDKDLFLLIDNKENKYEPTNNSDITIIIGDKDLFLEDVNPGLSLNGQVVFELAADVSNYNLQVSSGIGWSGGEYETIKLK